MAQTENFQSRKIFADSAYPDGFDRRLFAADVRVKAAHCDALFHAGILTRAESERIKNGLQAILKRAGYDANYFNELSAVDIHAFADARLAQLVGDAAEKLAVGTSGGDYAATVLRLWLREEIEKISLAARRLQTALVESAERQRAAALPGFALVKAAQPILWAHWCLANFERLARDRERLDEAWRRVNVMPLGSGVLAGINFEIDREQTARDLGFEGVSLNSFDAISDTDFAVEFVSACAITLTHLARLADDLTIFASEEFRFVEFGAANAGNFSPSESSALESVRGKAARIFGHQAALAAALPKNLADALGEIERAVFDTVDVLKICLRTSTRAVEILRVDEAETKNAAIKNRAFGAEIADYLLHKNVPYRAARQTAEKIVALADSKGVRVDEITVAEMRKIEPQIEPDISGALSLEQMLAGKSQIGGTAPERVSEALEAARAALEMEE